MEAISTTHDVTLKSLLFPIPQVTHLLILNQAKLSQLVDRRGLLGVRMRRALRLSSATFINAHLKMTRIAHRTHFESVQVEKCRNLDLWLVHGMQAVRTIYHPEPVMWAQNDASADNIGTMDQATRTAEAGEVDLSPEKNRRSEKEG